MNERSNPWSASRPGNADPLAHDVAAVLRRMGGSAHQSVVVDCVTAMKRQRGETVAQDLAARIIEVMERCRDLFFRPYGEGSMRWALTPQAV